MIPVSVEPRPWPRRRWWTLVALAFSIQLGLIFWLSDRSPVPPHRPAIFPALRLAGNAAAELLALNDPTLFALPHRQGFSGLAWLGIPRPPFRSFEWSEEPCWLQFSVQPPGVAFNPVAEIDNLSLRSTLARPEPEPTLPESLPLAAGPTQSTLRVEGDLAGRKLIQPIALPSWPYKDILTNSVVQVVVDSEGRPVSVPVLLSSSGYNEADKHALQQTKTARFESVSHDGPGTTPDLLAQLSWGKLVFVWHTLPMPPTNAPLSAP
jgi:TonB family protein